MRIRANKLVYLPIGGALAAGLLVTAFVQPQSKLAASQDCYGSCHSTTTLTLNRSTVVVGRESRVEFRVKVSADTAANGVPTGSVDVQAGTTVLCHFDLSHGRGSCSPGDSELAPGSYRIAALYSGDANNDPSTSSKKRLRVTRDSSRTDLSLSRSTVTVGRESDEEFRVSVSAGGASAGEPTGSVDVRAGGRVLCRLDLSQGNGRCSLNDRQLRAGSYEIEARYRGDADFAPSVSDRKHLTVRR